VKIIRTFKPTDTFNVIKLSSETLTEQYTPNLFIYLYETYPDGFIVAEYNHKIIGFLIGVKVKPDKAKILMLAVSPLHQKQKVGSSLANEFFKRIINENINQVELEVRTDNTKAIKFYEKIGFKIVDKIPKFYQNQEDAYTMRLMI